MARIRLYAADLQPAALPPVCIVCGRPSVIHVAHAFTWRPAWSSTVILLTTLVCCLPLGLVLTVVSLVRARRRTIDCPVCERHQRYWTWRGFLLSVPLLVLSAAVITLSVLILTERIPLEMFSFLFVATGLLLAGWGIAAALLGRGTVRCLEITEESMLLEQVSREFAAGVEFERKGIRSPPEDADIYEPYPAGDEATL